MIPTLNNDTFAFPGGAALRNNDDSSHHHGGGTHWRGKISCNQHTCPSSNQVSNSIDVLPFKSPRSSELIHDHDLLQTRPQHEVTRTQLESNDCYRALWNSGSCDTWLDRRSPFEYFPRNQQTNWQKRTKVVNCINFELFTVCLLMDGVKFGGVFQ